MVTKVMTPEFRVSYPNVFTPKSFQEGQEAKYSIQMIFDKGADLSKLKELAATAVKEKWGDKPPKKMRSPFRDGNEEREDAHYKDTIFMNCSSKFQPGLINERKEEIIDEKDFYPGCYAIATVNAYAYEFMGNAGVAFGLQNIMKMKDGEKLGGDHSAAADFDSVVAGTASGDFSL